MSIGLWLKEVIEHSPTNPVMNPEIQGWMVKDAFDEFVCNQCASRVMARGCWKWSGGKSRPVWSDQPKPAKCCCCEE